MGDTKDNITINQNSLNIILDARKGKIDNTQLYLKDKRNAPKWSSYHNANRNLQEFKKVQDENYKKEYWRKKLDVPQEMNINVVHWFSHTK